MSEIENEIRRMMQAAELGSDYMRGPLQDWGRRIWAAAEKTEAQVVDLQRQLAEAVGQAEAAKQATREIMAERNTWARQLADAMDERQTALDEVDKARELASIASNDRDNLHIAIDELAVEWDTRARTAAGRNDWARAEMYEHRADDIRRVIARWETT